MAEPAEKVITIHVNWRKIRNVVLIVAAAVALVAVVWNVAHAAISSTQVDTWDGETVDTSWFDVRNRQESYTLTSGAQLAGLAKIVNDGTFDFDDVEIRLGSNIDLGNHEWTPIGGDPSSSKVFTGDFDGQGNTISNLSIMSQLDYQALFSCVSDGTIKNLVVKGTVYGRDNAAGIACEASNENFENVVSDVDIVCRGYWQNAPTAGFVGHYFAQTEEGVPVTYHITDCRNNGSVEARNWQVAGFIGAAVLTQDATLEVKNCQNSGYVYVEAASSNQDQAIAGFIADLSGQGTYRISKCSNTADVSSDEIITVSGLIGCVHNYDVTLTDCRNEGAVSTNAYDDLACAAGIVGSRTGSYEMSGCKNTGELSVFMGSTVDLGV